MSLLIREEHRDTAFTISSAMEDSTIGGHYGKSIGARIPIPKFPLKKAYLVLSISMNTPFNPMYKWKIALDEVVLTREYKPNIESIIANTIHAIFVYDVTSTIHTEEPQLRIVYDGKNPIRIDSAILMSLHQYSGFHSYIEGVINIASLHNELTYNYGTPQTFNPNEGKIYIAAIAQRSDEISISVEGLEKMSNVRLTPGFNLVELPLSIPKISTLKLRALNTSTRHIFTMLVSSHTEYPSIDLQICEYDAERGVIRLSIVNKGSTAPDAMMLVLLRYGSVLFRKEIDPIKPGETKEIEVQLKDKKTLPSLIRIVWHKATKTFVVDSKPPI